MHQLSQLKLKGFDQTKLITCDIDGIPSREITVHLEINTHVLSWEFVRKERPAGHVSVSTNDCFSSSACVGVLSDLLC